MKTLIAEDDPSSRLLMEKIPGKYDPYIVKPIDKAKLVQHLSECGLIP
jgi:hypothetical protein